MEPTNEAQKGASAEESKSKRGAEQMSTNKETATERYERILAKWQSGALDGKRFGDGWTLDIRDRGDAYGSSKIHGQRHRDEWIAAWVD